MVFEITIGITTGITIGITTEQRLSNDWETLGNSARCSAGGDRRLDPSILLLGVSKKSMEGTCRTSVPDHDCLLICRGLCLPPRTLPHFNVVWQLLRVVAAWVCGPMALLILCCKDLESILRMCFWGNIRVLASLGCCWQH